MCMLQCRQSTLNHAHSTHRHTHLIWTAEHESTYWMVQRCGTSRPVTDLHLPATPSIMPSNHHLMVSIGRGSPSNCRRGRSIRAHLHVGVQLGLWWRRGRGFILRKELPLHRSGHLHLLPKDHWYTCAYNKSAVLDWKAKSTVYASCAYICVYIYIRLNTEDSTVLLAACINTHRCIQVPILWVALPANVHL